VACRRLDVGLGIVHRPQVLFLDADDIWMQARAHMDEIARFAIWGRPSS
jgi:hypothetical protein